MGKQIIIITFLGLFVSIGNAQTIYSQNFTSINGASVSMSSFQNKRVVILLAPTNVSDSASFEDIRDFQQQYGTDSIQLIGVMSIEHGYKTENASALGARFQSMGINIMLTNGMQVMKSAGSNQSSLMKWLTDISLNNYYNGDARALGNKFFINRNGKLVGYAMADFAVEAPLISYYLSSQD